MREEDRNRNKILRIETLGLAAFSLSPSVHLPLSHPPPPPPPRPQTRIPLICTHDTVSRIMGIWFGPGTHALLQPGLSCAVRSAWHGSSGPPRVRFEAPRSRRQHRYIYRSPGTTSITPAVLPSLFLLLFLLPSIAHFFILSSPSLFLLLFLLRSIAHSSSLSRLLSFLFPFSFELFHSLCPFLSFLHFP